MIFDVIVVGAGIAGASVAYQLGGQGTVLVMERESQPGYHATGRSAALFLETYGSPHIQALTRASRKFYEQPPAGFSDVPLLGERGLLYMAHAGQEALLQATYETLAQGSSAVILLSRDDVLRHVPVARSDTLIGGILEPDARDLDVDALHQGYLRGMRERGVILKVNAGVQAAAFNDGCWTLTTETGERVQGRTVVNAAGAWADHIAELCGVHPVGLRPCRRSAFTFDGPAGIDFSHWPAVVGVDESYYFKPDAGQLLGSPANADPVEAHDVMPEELDIATGIYQIEQATTLSIRRPRHTWAGLRSFVADEEFVIGWDAQAPAFFWLAAQGGCGIQTAQASSLLAAALLRGQPVPDALTQCGVNPERVRPDRF